jgi:elongation factor P
MKIDGNAIRPGNIIAHKDSLWRVVKVQNVKPGKGGAYAQAELKDVYSGTKTNERFRASEKVQRVRIEERAFQFLYRDGEAYIFMDQQSFDQIHLSADIIGEDALKFLHEELIVTIGIYEGAPLSFALPETMACLIQEAESVVKGQTQSGASKPALLDNGVRVMVPTYVEAGMKIIVNTTDFSFVERQREE